MARRPRCPQADRQRPARLVTALLVGSLALGAAAEGISNFGGTWYVLNSSGDPVTSSQSSSSTGGGYGY